MNNEDAVNAEQIRLLREHQERQSDGGVPEAVCVGYVWTHAGIERRMQVVHRGD